VVACRRYEAESAIRLGLPYEPSAAVTSAVEICDEIAEALCGWADEECEEGEEHEKIYEDDTLHSIVDEYNEEEPFQDLERALCMATRPFPDLKACAPIPVHAHSSLHRFNSIMQRRRQEEDDHLAVKEIRAEQVSEFAGCLCSWCLFNVLHVL
jgi:hypothetical protein